MASLTILRGTDLTRLMVTLGVALILLELANKLDWLTGGADGLQGVVMGPVLGVFEFDLDGRTAAWYSLAVLLVLLPADARGWCIRPSAPRCKAIRDNRLRAMAIGIPVRVAPRRSIYTMAAAMAGAAGALLAQTTGFASLDVLAFDRSADVMLMLVIGGVGLAVRRRGGRGRLQADAGLRCRPSRRSTGCSGSACSWCCWCWSAATGCCSPWTWFGEREERHERHAAARRARRRCSAAGPGEALRRHHRHRQRRRSTCGAARAMR